MGQITIDNINLKDLNIHSLRQNIGIVQQEPILFHGTIFENIVLGDKNVDQKRVEEVCRIANAMEFIENLKEV